MKITFDTRENQKQKDCARAWINPVISDIVYGGAKGGGKSYLGASLIFGDALIYPGTHYFIARKKLNDLRKFTIPTIYEVFQSWGLTSKYYTYNGQDNFFLLYNGSKVFLLEAAYMPSDPLYQRFGSMQMTRGWIEEAGDFEEAAKNNLMASIGRWKNDEYNLSPKLLQTCNPAKNYLYREYYRKKKDAKLEEWKEFITALPYDNKMLPAGYLENLERSLSPNEKKRLLQGSWEYDSDPAALMDYDKIIQIFENKNVGLVKDEHTGQMVATGAKKITVDVARFGGDRIVMITWVGFRGKVFWWKREPLDVTASKIEQQRLSLDISKSDILVDEDGVGCLIPGTLVLTKKGWVRVETILPGDLVYSKGLDNNLIEAPVTSNAKREVTDIIEDETGIAFSFSHFLPYHTRKEHEMLMGSWDGIMEKNAVHLDVDFNWIGTDFTFTLPDTKYTMPYGGDKVLSNGLSIHSKNFATFLGWYISEGSNDGKYIRITQNMDSKYILEIEDCFRACGFRFYGKVQGNKRAIDYMICQKALLQWVNDNCYTEELHKSFTKKIPDIIKQAPKVVIESFLYSFNQGDGHFHKGERMYSTSSTQLALDLREIILKAGKMTSRKVKMREGSTGMINGRVITRKRDGYLIAEKKEYSGFFRPKVKRVYEDHVYNLEIDSPTKLYLVQFDKFQTPFFVHNGGIVDFYKCKGFVNNARAIPSPDAQLDRKGNPIPENFDHVKSQCYFRLAKRVNENGIFIDCDDPEIKQLIIEELEQVKQKALDSDMKKGVIPKDEVKELLGRSPDFADTLMMREYFELIPKFSWTAF